MKISRTIRYLSLLFFFLPPLLFAEDILSIHSQLLLVKEFSAASNLYLTALNNNTKESYAAAMEKFDAVLQQFPRHSTAHIYKADCMNAMGIDPQNAYQTAYTLLMEKKNERERLLGEVKDPALYSDLVYCLNGMQRYDDAKTMGTKGLIAGKHPDLYLNLAYTFVKLGKEDFAREFLCKASKMRPLLQYKDMLTYRRIFQTLEKMPVFDGMACEQNEKTEHGEFYALMISLSEYRHKNQGLSTLPYTDNDVRGLYRVLTNPETGMFSPDKVTVLNDRDATLDGVKKNFDRLAAVVNKEDTVLIFFAGHGYTSPMTKEAYWLTYDTEIGNQSGNRIDSTAFSSTELAKKIMALKSDNIIFFVDACQSGGVSEQTTPRGLDNYLHPGKNYSIIASSQPNQLSMGIKEYQHGLFSYHLIQGLKGNAEINNDGRIDFEELWTYVRKHVSEDATRYGREQNPKIFNSSSSSVFLTRLPEY